MKEERGQYGSSAFADLAADFETVASNGNKSEIEIKGGLLHVRGDNLRTLRFVPDDFSKENPVVYDLNEKLELTKVEDFAGGDFVSKKCAYPQGVISVEEASVLYVDEKGNRWRLPKNDVKFDEWMKQGLYRVCREVATERDLLNVHGTFFELLLKTLVDSPKFVPFPRIINSFMIMLLIVACW